MRTVRVPSKIAWWTVLLAACLQTASALGAHQAQATGRILLASVVDSSGKTQVDFGVDDFLIKEGGDEREVLDVHVADYPIVMLIDDGPQSSDLRPIKSASTALAPRRSIPVTQQSTSIVLWWQHWSPAA